MVCTSSTIGDNASPVETLMDLAVVCNAASVTERTRSHLLEITQQGAALRLQLAYETC